MFEVSFITHDQEANSSPGWRFLIERTESDLNRVVIESVYQSRCRETPLCRSFVAHLNSVVG